jgi:transposase-like protein
MWSRRTLLADGVLRSNLRCDHPGGRPKALPADKQQLAVQLYQEKKIAVKQICEVMGISKPTLYAYVRQAQSAS